MAPIVATLFFAPGDRTAALLGAFAVFAVSFFVRPVGGIFFGYLGDKAGRRNTLAACVVLMSLSTFAIGLLPTYASVGLLAPILLLVCRLGQGFSAGGEFAGAAAFVVEYAPEDRRAWYASVVPGSVVAGLLCGVGTVALLTASLGQDAMATWGWRVPFLLALPLGLVGLYLRLKLEDTPAFRTIEARNTVAAAPIREALRTQWKPMAVLFGFTFPPSVGLYIATAYMPTYLGEAVGLDRGTALLSNAIALFALMLLCPVSGLLADRIGRKPMLTMGCGGFILATVPAFLIVGRGDLLSAVLGQVLLVVPLAFVVASAVVSLVEMFPTRLRYSSGSMAWNLMQMVFGGTAPLVATFLIARSGDILAPAYYVTALSVVATLVVVFAFKETLGSRLVRDADVAGDSVQHAAAKDLG